MDPFHFHRAVGKMETGSTLYGSFMDSPCLTPVPKDTASSFSKQHSSTSLKQGQVISMGPLPIIVLR